MVMQACLAVTLSRFERDYRSVALFAFVLGVAGVSRAGGLAALNNHIGQ